MSGFAHRLVAREILDDPVDDLDELEGSLHDIELANRWLGGREPVLREVGRLRPSTLLDVGTGSADIPLALARRAERRGRPLAITALDASAQIIGLARKRTGGHPALNFAIADALTLPFADGSFDVVTCNLALHHFDPPEARMLLAELRRVARRTPLVCDLRRSLPAYLGAYLFSRLVSANRLTRNDAPLSVRRAYTPAEAAALAREAGWRDVRVRRYPFFRMALTDG